MDWKKFLAEYFSFTRRDRIAILSLIVIICGVYFIPPVVNKKSGIQVKDSLMIASAEAMLMEKKNDPPNPNYKKNYNQKKYYGKTSYKKHYSSYQPYINEGKNQRHDYSSKNYSASSKKKFFEIDINQADTSAWIELPGIGSKLSNRIVSFREKLGGFYSIEQVGETFGLKDSVFQKIKRYLQVDGSTIRKININTCTVDELKSHPYIRYVIANAIVSYRNEHGEFTSLDDLKKVMAVTEEVYNKILPYISVE